MKVFDICQNTLWKYLLNLSYINTMTQCTTKEGVTISVGLAVVIVDSGGYRCAEGYTIPLPK